MQRDLTTLLADLVDRARPGATSKNAVLVELDLTSDKIKLDPLSGSVAMDGQQTAVTPRFGFGGAPTLNGAARQTTVADIYTVLPIGGLTWNLVTDGAFAHPELFDGTNSASAWFPSNQASNTNYTNFVIDPLAPSGFAVIITKVSAGATYPEVYQGPILVRPGTQYTYAGAIRTDGAAQAQIGMAWYDNTGHYMGDLSQTTVSSTPTTYTAFSVTATAPGYAAFATFICAVNSNVTAGKVWFSSMRLVQGAVDPGWSSALQQFSPYNFFGGVTFANSNTDGQRCGVDFVMPGLITGLSCYEGATNLVTPARPSSSGNWSGTFNGFNDPFNNLNAWTTISGSPTVASNLVTLNGALIRGGFPNFWHINTGSQFRFKWVTNGTANMYVKYIDANNWVRLRADGTNLHIDKNVAGTVTSDVSTAQAAALTNGNFYWFIPTLLTGGPPTQFSNTLANDNAGAPGTTVATFTNVNITNFTGTNGGYIALEGTGAAIQFGGAFTDVCKVVQLGVTGLSVVVNAGVPAFCLNSWDLTTFQTKGYSLGVYNNDTGASGSWSATTTVANAQATISCRTKTSTIVLGAGTGAYLQCGAVQTSGLSGTNDWTVQKATGTPAANSNCLVTLDRASGLARFDLLWVAQQAYDTGNSDPTGQQYMPYLTSSQGQILIASPTSVRPPTNCVIPVVSQFNIADFSRVATAVFDHAYNLGNTRALWSYAVDGNNFIQLFVDASGNITLQKARAGTVSSITDAAATAFAAGDTVAVGVRHSATVGLEMQVAKNGGTVTTYSNTTAEAKNVLSGKPTNYLGCHLNTNNLDGTIGIDREMAAGLSAATVTAYVQNPYQSGTTTDLVLWGSDYPYHNLGLYDFYHPTLLTIGEGQFG